MDGELDLHQALDEVLETRKGTELNDINFVTTAICNRLGIGKDGPSTQEVREFIARVLENTIDIPAF